MGAAATAKLGLAFLLTAAALDTAALYVPAVALLVIAAGARAWVALAVRGVSIEREPGPPTVVEGQTYPLHFRVGTGAVPLAGEICDPLVAEPYPLRFRLRRRERLLRGEVRLTGRGRRRLEPTRLVVFDPLRICTREVRARRGTDVLVLPRIEPVVASASGGASAGEIMPGEREGPRTGVSPDVEIDGIRPYRPGSPASRIHWPVFARHGELVERNLVGGGDGSPLVIVDAAQPASNEALDAAVRAAASLCVHLARTGGCVLIAGRQGASISIDPQLRSWPRAHARLALLQAGEAPHLGAASAIGDGAIFWVTAAAPGAGSRMPAGKAGFLVTPLPVEGRPSEFTVAGCVGAPLPVRSARRLRRAA